VLLLGRRYGPQPSGLSSIHEEYGQTCNRSGWVWPHRRGQRGVWGIGSFAVPLQEASFPIAQKREASGLVRPPEEITPTNDRIDRLPRKLLEGSLQRRKVAVNVVEDGYALHLPRPSQARHNAWQWLRAPRYAPDPRTRLPPLHLPDRPWQAGKLLAGSTLRGPVDGKGPEGLVTDVAYAVRGLRVHHDCLAG
jgi:hypothetical protein